MKKLLVATMAIASFATVSAQAADMAARAPVYKAPPPPPAFSWTGCYIGGNVGGGWGRSSFSTGIAPGSHLGDPTNLNAVSAAGTGTVNDDGNVLGGGQIGCNYQTGAFVFGLEADMDAYQTNPALTGSGLLTTGDTFVIANGMKTNWLATVRPRFGVTFDRSLFYATGGLALTDLKYTQSYADTLLNTTGGTSASQTKAGWTVGGGWEYAINNNWSAKVEYLYAHFSSLNTVGTVVSTAGGTNVITGSGDLQEQIVRAGINYRFGPTPFFGQ